VDLRVWQDGMCAGPVLMLQDRELLEKAERGELEPTLRFYEWSEPTVSLGFHQSEGILDRMRMKETEVPWVRRPTGGAAVLHSEELTYAIVIPDGGSASARIQERVSRAIAEGLRAVGVDAVVESRGEPLTALRNRSSCFARTSRWEVTVRGRKIVGSAQRKLSRALLQHGSVLTGPDHLRIADFLRLPSEDERTILRKRLTERSTCVADELGHAVPVERLREALAASFRRVFAVVDTLSPMLQSEGRP